MNDEMKFALFIESDRRTYKVLPVKARDLKALAAFLNAFADAPETVDTCIGPFHLQIEVSP